MLRIGLRTISKLDFSSEIHNVHSHLEGLVRVLGYAPAKWIIALI